ncbi:MAG: bifunctional alpha,alpha-trehalose-phosphate synthase (UDP-forming)/trehalose-phosphatase [Acidobacteriota bacterium]|nr:bifunctional alpha,alpha-trehalose-phosphate synthase (UDP-forming)/trehalose-phosphatase [Acidobacteriota bacterium]
MPDNSRLIVVSNRLPVALVREDAGWDTKRTAGGLATAMDPILKKAGGLWIGWAGAEEELPPEAVELLRQKQSCIAVALPPDLLKKFYEGYANQALWPLFHSFTSKLQFDPESWAAYIEANRRFCSAVVHEFRPGDRIWVHDYHLMLLPGMLRESLPDAAIGFFLHIPFPGSDIFSLLPRGEELLSGLVGADLIAFHTHLHLQHFRMSLRRLLGLESTIDRLEVPGRQVRLQALPIGIAPNDFIEYSDKPETQEHLNKLRTQYAGRKLIVAVDRLDYTKGLPNRLRAFRRMLSGDPGLIGKIVLLQIAVPSRENIESYQDLRSEVHELISDINGEYGTADWVPVVYIHRGISRPELVAVYQFADVAWVAPLRDGMNLVAKEYVACRGDGRGVLVLSSFAGAAAEMAEALLVNPFDEERTAFTVLRALAMSDEEKQERMLALHERVLRNDVFVWGDRFLALLDEAVKLRRERAPESPPPLPVTQVIAAYREAEKRLLLLDYDGTLVPFAFRPQDATPDRDLLTLLARLTSDCRNCVVVISGRSAADLQRWLGQVPHLGLAPEHGARWRLPDSDTWGGRSAETEWKNTVKPILQHFVDRTPGSFIEEKEFALVWHFRMIEAEFGDWLATELVAMLEGMLAETELRAYRGHKIVEIKPMWANKGALATELLPGYAANAFILGIGDDQTDEDLFAHLPENAWSVYVGGGQSKAFYSVADTGRVRHVLRQLAQDDPAENNGGST